MLRKGRPTFGEMFVGQWLYEQGFTISANGKKIIRPLKYKVHEIKPLEPMFKIGSPIFYPKQDFRILKNAEELEYVGYKIISLPAPPIPWHRNQKQVYRIVPITHHSQAKKIQKPHFVRYDIINKRIRLECEDAGPFGYGDWINLKSKSKPIEIQRTDLSEGELLNKEINKLVPGYEVQDRVWRKISGIPVLITEDGREIVCLRETKDEPIFGIIGMRGMGKTTCMNSMAGHAYWLAKKRVAILNDHLGQCMDWAHPLRYERSPYDRFMLQRLAKINETTLPLPVVPIYPNTNAFSSKEISLRYEGTYEQRFTMSWEKTLKNFEEFFRHKKEYQLEAASADFRKLVPKYAKIKTLEDVDRIHDEERLIQNTRKIKFRTIIEDMFKEELFDVNTSVPAFWKVKKDIDTKTYEPVGALLYSQLIPLVITKHITGKQYFPYYMKHMVDYIFELQKTDEFKRSKILTWIFVDELQRIADSVNKNVAGEALCRVATEGRFIRLGMVYALQNWYRIDRNIRSNTTHALAFGSKAKDAKLIKEDFDLKPGWISTIINLKEREAVAITQKQFDVYDTDTGKKYSITEPVKGEIIPTLNTQSAPR